MSAPAVPADILAELEALRDVFRADAASLVEALASDWRATLAAPSPERVRSLVRQAHSLAGTAGSFALTDLSARARDLERFLEGLPPAGGAAALEEGVPLLRALEAEAAPRPT